MRRILLVFFLSLLVFSFVVPFQCQAGLVPCGTERDPKTGKISNPCQLCHFFVLFENIIDFILTRIVPPIAVLMIAVGGFMYVFAFANPEGTVAGSGGPALVSKANSLFRAVVFGLIIIFAAWLIVNVFFVVIGVADWTGLKEGWWKIKCP